MGHLNKVIVSTKRFEGADRMKMVLYNLCEYIEVKFAPFGLFDKSSLWHCMEGQCSDLSQLAAPLLYAAADLPTTANERSISLRSDLLGFTLVRL